MSKSSLKYIGIDVSKSDLAIAIPVVAPSTPLTKLQSKKKNPQWEHCVLKNETVAIESWLSKQDLKNSHFILEATGTYSSKVIAVLTRLDAVFSVLNPRQSKAWAVATGHKNKTDRQDAQILSDFGAKNQPQPYKPISPEAQKRQQAVSALRAFKKQLQAIRNQIHALEQLPEPDPVILKGYEIIVETLQKQIQAFQELIQPTPDEPQLQKVVQLIVSIPGIGQDTAHKITALLGDLSQFKSAKALAAFIGVSPCIRQSGTSLDKATTSTQGIPEIKLALYNCARSAIQHNPICKKFYRNLVDHKFKKKMVALVAVMHKLVRMIWGIVHSEVPFKIAV
jgi:transposase